MLGLRVLTAVLGLPTVLGLLMFGPKWATWCFFLCCCGLSVFESISMLLPRMEGFAVSPAEGRKRGKKNPDQGMEKLLGGWPFDTAWFFPLVCVCIACMIFLGLTLGSQAADRGILVLGLMLSIMVAVFATRGIETEMARVMSFVVAIVYGGLPWVVIWDLYARTDRALYLILLLVIVWAGDTGAYFGGRFFGKHSMAPSKSPKKTWEGAAAGLLASVLAAFAFNHFVPGFIGAPERSLVVGALVGISGQLGDLVESVFKRFSQVKDSGSLLPGHGGILDRVDGLLFAAPALWFILFGFN